MESSVERVKANRRRRRQAHLRLTFRIICCIIVFCALSYLLHRPWIHFGKIEVVNGSAITAQEVIKMVGIKEPINLFNVDGDQIEKVLSNDLRVEKVETSYGWPNVLKVIVTERKPAVYVACAYGGFAKIAVTGHVLEVSNGIKDASAPFVSGWILGNIYTGDQVEDEDMLSLLKFLNEIDPKVHARIAEIIMNPDSKIKVLLSSGIPIILGTPEDMPKKVATFNTVYNELETKKVKAAYIDLSYEKPYIKLR